MSHDASKVLLGHIPSSVKEVSNYAGDPAALPAGTIVRLKSDDTLSKASADGLPLGVSLGKDQGANNRVAVARQGLSIPLLLTADFTPTIGAQVHISDTTGLGVGSGAGATGMNAVYRSGVLTGIAEDGSEVDVALIDMQGGL